MKIIFSNAGKRFNYEWILKNINYTFQSPATYAIVGPNGSGKSTLLQMIAGALSPSTGSISYYDNSAQIPADGIFKYLTIAAPYLELVEEFSLEEQILFQLKFKSFYNNLSTLDVANISELKSDSSKEIRNFSSGMKQRLKVALAVLADVPVILLDEPTTNLDQKGVEWYLELMKNFADKRLVIVSSNLDREIGYCTSFVDVLQYK
ncbi:MAG: ATP-binding cassette domain-containing protein [Chitinophagales bacterium]|nr:ATP-binding cassette domain-containing protein [Chitinophagales bacterium]